MKILTVCEGGAVRSVALASYLKWEHTPSHDALAASWAKNTEGTLRQLCEWADLIVVMELHHQEKLPCEYRPGHPMATKVKVCDVGRDRWLNPMHRELQQLCREWVEKEGL